MQLYASEREEVKQTMINKRTGRKSTGQDKTKKDKGSRGGQMGRDEQTNLDINTGRMGKEEGNTSDMVDEDMYGRGE